MYAWSPEPLPGKRPLSLFSELKRRNVFKVGTAYVVTAWLVTQVLQVVFESFGTPAWVMKTVLVLLATGLPFALFFAWAFELTPEGLKRETEVDPAESITPQTGRKLNHLITAVLVIALAYFAFDKFILRTARDAAPAGRPVTAEKQRISPALEPEKSIAVLPFVNMSDDRENEYFSDGLTEELLNALARVKGLKVTGRTSSFAFKGKNVDLREIGHELGVANVLEGSVRKAGNRVRITAQLVKSEDGYHLWSDTFDRDLDDIFAIQEEIAATVAAELTRTLLQKKPEPLVHVGTKNTKAYEAYLQGRYLFVRNADDEQVQDRADALFQQALDLDPKFALALFGQFEVLDFRRRNGAVDYKKSIPRLRELADQVTATDPQLPEGQVALGRVAQMGMHWSESEAAYKRALSLSPGNMSALHSMAGLLGLLGRKSEQLDYAQQALVRDPLNLAALTGVMSANVGLGRCEDAEDIAKRALSLVPGAPRVNYMLGTCLLQHRQAYARARDLFAREPLDFLHYTGLAIAYNKLGQQDKAQRAFDDLSHVKGEVAAYQYAQILAQWGQTERALDALQHAWDIGDSGFVRTNADAYLDPLRGEPRFEALLEKWRHPSD